MNSQGGKLAWDWETSFHECGDQAVHAVLPICGLTPEGYFRALSEDRYGLIQLRYSRAVLHGSQRARGIANRGFIAPQSLILSIRYSFRED